MLSRLRSWLAGVFTPNRLEQDLADELKFHLEARTEDLVRRGLAPADAARQARIEFGAAERYKEECRESRGLRLFHEFRGDLRYALRGLRKTPGFSAVVVLSLALGIGANTAMFSVVNGVLLRPMPYRDSGRLVSIREDMPDRTFRYLPYLQVLPRREELNSFEDVAAMQYAGYQLIDVSEPEELSGGWVTANLCPFLGVQPAIGRCFTPEDEASRAKVTLLSYALWQRQYGGDPGILGKSIPLRDFEGEKRFTVIGVLPPQFQFVQKADLMMPMSESPNYRDRNSSWTPSVVVARLKPRIEVGQARTELLAVQRRLFPNNHEGAGGRKIVVLPIAEYLAQTVKTGLVILLCVVALVLLITCANIANLILSRDCGRQREIAVRTALGAGRFRICRQLLTEAVTLALGGGVAGLIGAQWIVRGIKALAFARLPRIDEIGIDWKVLAYTGLITLASGMLFGLMPSLRLSRVDLADTMKSGGRSATGGKYQQKLMNGLVVFEVALCAVAMMGAGLLVNTFIRLKGIDPGFHSGRLLVASLNRRSSSPLSQTDFYGQVLAQVRSIPGIEAAALTNYPPPYHVRSIQDFRLPETSGVFGPGGPEANARAISPDYFRTMGIRLIRGRDFKAKEIANSRRSTVISEAMAKHYWPGQDPIGKTILLREYRKEVPADVIGVARDVRQSGLRDEPEDQMYFSYAQTDAPGNQTLIVRTAANPLSFVETIKREIRAVDRNQAFRILKTMDMLMADEVAEPRFYMILLGGYGMLGLLLTALGIGGLVAFSVSRRTREIGLRISFGASRLALLRMFAAGNLRLVIAGLIIGVPGSYVVTRYARTLLYEVTPADPWTIAMVTAILGVVSISVAAVAAFRATTVEPASVLRHE
jgi:putative ABC transport system permease protein